METETVKLVRDGKRALEFEGELIAEDDNHSHEGPTQNRWTEVSVYQTKGGKIVVGVAHISQWQGETDCYSAEVFASIEEAAAYIEGAELPNAIVMVLMRKLNITEKIE